MVASATRVSSMVAGTVACVGLTAQGAQKQHSKLLMSSRCAINDESHDHSPDRSSRGAQIQQSWALFGVMFRVHVPSDQPWNHEPGVIGFGHPFCRVQSPFDRPWKWSLKALEFGTRRWVYLPIDRLEHKCHQSSSPPIDAQLISTPTGSITRKDSMSDGAQDEPQSHDPLAAAAYGNGTKAAFNGVGPPTSHGKPQQPTCPSTRPSISLRSTGPEHRERLSQDPIGANRKEMALLGRVVSPGP